MILDGYYLSLQYRMFQCIEYGRQREYDALLQREVCSRDLEEVRDDGLQDHGYTYGIEPEAIE